MRLTRAALAVALITTLLGTGAAFGQAENRDLSPSGTNALPADAQTLARMYRQTFNAYRGLAAGYIFQTHLGVGMVAELSANKVYSSDRATTMLDRMTGGMLALRQLLKVVTTLKLPEGDRRTMATILKLTAQVDAEAKALTRYLLTGKQADAVGYHKARGQTADAINKFLSAG